MKKILFVLLVIALALSACNVGGPPDDDRLPEYSDPKTFEDYEYRENGISVIIDK
ncbi:MAG: membrane lipoprotein lipid attachment site-containing protein [Treponema sp.]|jgi:hypothetical protein|nr:membrane lipoprotein lipid attachment site-containing protein [Treponema sp.]